MNKEVVVLIAEDDSGHARLITKNLTRAGIGNQILHFKDGQEILDYLFQAGTGPHRKIGAAYLLLLDIRMPRVDGVGVLEKIKKDMELRKIPVIMLTTSDNPNEIKTCYLLGCSNYIKKPVQYDDFAISVKRLALFLSVVKVPIINGSLN